MTNGQREILEGIKAITRQYSDLVVELRRLSEVFNEILTAIREAESTPRSGSSDRSIPEEGAVAVQPTKQ